MAPYDPDSFLGVIIEQMTTNISGDITLTLIYLFVLLTLVVIGVGLPVEIAFFVVLPALIVLMAASGEFVLVGLLIFFFLAAVLAKTFFLR